MSTDLAPTEIVDTPAEAAREDLAPLLVRRPLEAWLDAAGLGAGTIEAERIGDGHSNVTYLIRRGGERFVLRRPPRPPLPPSAHDVLREARLLGGVARTAVRAPRVLARCEDESVLGVPFYVMEYVEGEVPGAELPPALDTPAERRRMGLELVDALVEIHAVDWRGAGLEGLGRPSGYLDRQLRRFTGLWEHNATREVPEVARAGAWLAEHKPEEAPAAIVHGDYRLGNTMYAPGAPARLVAVLDWELCSIGDPLADLGYLTVTYAEADDPDTMLFRLSEVTRREGFPSREELIDRYEERSGRAVANLRWYQALALWKSAVFLEGNLKRYKAGTTDDPWYRLLEEGVPYLARAALDVSRGEAVGA